MRRRIGRPGLMGTMARTAVVAGTATAVAGGVRSRQQAASQQAAPQPEVLQAAPPPPPAQAPTAPADDTIAQLTKLGDLKTAGILTDAEFTAAKAKLLGL